MELRPVSTVAIRPGLNIRLPQGQVSDSGARFSSPLVLRFQRVEAHRKLLEDRVQQTSLGRVQRVEHSFFVTEGKRRDLVVDTFAFCSEFQFRHPTVLLGRAAPNLAAIDEPGNGPTHGHFVHGGASRDLGGRDPALFAEHGDDSPLRDADAEPLGIGAGDQPADSVSQHGQSVGCEVMQLHGTDTIGGFCSDCN